MRFGVTRYGPLAPLALQLGKYDALTSTGEPTRSTSKRMSLSSERMLVTWAASTGRWAGGSTETDEPTVFRSDSTLCALTRCHSLGPEAAKKTS